MRRFGAVASDAIGRSVGLFCRSSDIVAACSALSSSFALTRTLTLETYAAPFVSEGTYSTRSLSATSMAPDYAARFTLFVPPASTPLYFHVRQVRINAVARWEYAPGSTLFVVWSRASDLGLPIRNSVTLKVSYWLDRSSLDRVR
jgi:hypothetical protein